MEPAERTLARIEKATLGYEDHGLLTSYIFLEYAQAGQRVGGSGQGFGGRILGGHFTTHWIKGVLDAVGVDEWSKIEGQWVWALHEPTKVLEITGLLTGKTYNPDTYKAPVKEDGV